MAAFIANPWLIVLVPFGIALLLGLLGGRAKFIAPWLVAAGTLLTGVYGIAALSVVNSPEAPGGTWMTSTLAAHGTMRWFEVGATQLHLSWAVDSLTALMLAVVGLVATCVVIFSAGYMHGDRGWVRYFALIALFSGSMNLLVIGSSFATLFVGWELVGACSYLLIGFWYQKPSAAAAAIKAFLTTRVGDVGLLLGIALLWSAAGTDEYAALSARLGTIPQATLTAAAICLAIGAMGKSAQFPLHAWLPDAMEGPTPVSALIHAATMVAAGVFLVARVWPLFEAAPAARALLLAAGGISALGAALVATVQRDIKKVLAYSTISQLGFMFAALGVGAWVAAFFHLLAHAAFKALLFLASGSVIHGTDTQDLHEMGGLHRSMPVTFTVWVTGALALAGVVPFAGFFSKDAILESVLKASPLVAVALFAASLLTAFYAARATRLAFFGPPAKGLHAHESGLTMLFPLVILAVPALTLGFFAAPVSALLGHEPEPLALGVSAVALALAAVGGVAGWLASAGVAQDLKTAERLGRAHAVLSHAYNWDAFVNAVIVRPAVAFSRTLWAVGDRMIVDGIVEGSGDLAKKIGRSLSSLQTGDAQSYGLAIVIGALFMLAASVWLGR